MANQIKLSIKIENKKPVELNQLAISLNSLSCQYDSFLKKSQDFDYHKSERKLYISKLETGCIYAELLPAVMPLFNELNSVLSFGQYLKNIYSYFLGKEEKLNYNLTQKDCIELSEIVGQTANDNGSNLNMVVKGDNNTIIQQIIRVDSLNANAIQNGIRKFSDNKIEQPKEYYKELMYWATADFIKTPNKSSNKIIIEKIDKKAKKVVFLNEQDKISATTHNKNFPHKQWQNLAYIVDLEVSYIQDIPQEYKITKLYQEETFDPEED